MVACRAVGTGTLVAFQDPDAGIDQDVEYRAIAVQVPSLLRFSPSISLFD